MKKTEVITILNVNLSPQELLSTDRLGDIIHDFGQKLKSQEGDLEYFSCIKFPFTGGQFEAQSH